VNTSGEEVARIMRKYDLEAIPVVDELDLVSHVTIDDIIRFHYRRGRKGLPTASGPYPADEEQTTASGN
jgi:magnesium transporter